MYTADKRVWFDAGQATPHYEGTLPLAKTAGWVPGVVMHDDGDTLDIELDQPIPGADRPQRYQVPVAAVKLREAGANPPTPEPPRAVTNPQHPRRPLPNVGSGCKADRPPT